MLGILDCSMYGVYMKIQKKILNQIAAYLSATKKTESALGITVVNDSRLVENIRKGKITLANIQRLEEHIGDFG